MTAVMTKDRLADLMRNIRKLANKDVLVGIPASAPDDKSGPITNAQIGYILDQGSPAKNIPARPWLVPGVQDVQAQCADKLGIAAKAALDGNESGTMKALVSAGVIAENSVKAKINSNISPELADATLAARRRRGVTRTDTLVDTGGMRNAVTSVVRNKD